MNMDKEIVNRALYNVGEYLLANEDIEKENSKYLLCKEYYLSAFLEALSEVEWTGGRKREKLVPTGRPIIKNNKYLFAFDVPFDCAKPIELQNNENFMVEGRLIITDEERPELLYVSNGKILREAASVQAGRPGGLHEMEYLTAGKIGSHEGVILWSGRPESLPKSPDGLPLEIPVELPEDPEPDEDYPDYIALEYEPKFYEYVEKSLAAKFAMKLSSQPGLHIQLLQEALLIKQEAVKASKSSKAAKIKETPLWTEEIFK